MQYEQRLRYDRGLKNILDTAREAGKSEGREEGGNHEKAEIAKKLSQMGMSPKEIQEITGLSRENIERL